MAPTAKSIANGLVKNNHNDKNIIFQEFNVRIVILSLSIVLALSGCQTTNPYTGEKKASNSSKGAAIGAISGAVIGYLTSSKKDRRKGLLIGAGVGALSGAAIGNYMDKQEKKLRKELKQTGVSVTRSGNSIILNMPGNITFASGSSDLNARFFAVLSSITKVVNEYKSTLILIVGHTDSVGSEKSNLILSEKRANSVASYMSSQGILSNRIMIAGYGESQPIASNENNSGRQQNRRVEITLEPLNK
ncbi:MAG: glycine zipper 2TM domain-containing protein [Gammaproteobacteria bacterium]|nr:MAG: glycine zipper 2TM domain-containing protein [Gammaproteobacteria bacterium]